MTDGVPRSLVVSRWTVAVGSVVALWSMVATLAAVHARLELRVLEAENARLRFELERPPAPPLVAAAYVGDSCQDDKSRSVNLDDEVKVLTSEQARLVERVGVLAVRTVAEMEMAIRMVGLDPRTVAPVRLAAGPEGGPFVAPGQGRGTGGGLQASLDALDVHLDRWDELARVIRSLPLAEPLRDYSLTSPFGLRVDPVLNRTAIHEGADLAASIGSPVLATAAGTVVFAGIREGFGKVVEIDHGYDVHTVYAHLQSLAVRAGQKVRLGVRIGRLGSSGRTTGPHLHYEVRVRGLPRDPAQFLYIGRLVLTQLK